MISKKLYKADGSNKRFLSDFIIKSQQFCRPYVYVYDNTLNPDGSEDVLQDPNSPRVYPTNLYKRGANIPQSVDLVTVDFWQIVDNSVLFYEEPLAATSVWVEVATTASEFGDTLTAPSVERAEEAANNAAASAVAALASENAAKTSETNAKTSETNAKTSEDFINTKVTPTLEAQLTEVTTEPVKTSLANAATNANKAETEANRALSEADRALSEADRALSEADRAEGYATSIDPNSFVKKTGDTMTGNLLQSVTSGNFRYRGQDLDGHFYIQGQADRVRWVNKVGEGEQEIFSSSYLENRVTFIQAPKSNTSPIAVDHLTRKDYVDAQGIGGEGYSWVDETTNRVINDIYTNTFGKPIMLSIIEESANSRSWVWVDGVIISKQYSGSANTSALVHSVIVPNGSTYKFTVDNVGTILQWSELK